MKLQQILIETKEYSDTQGNQIIARSQGLDTDIAQQVAVWGTTRGGLLPRHLSAYFYTRLNHRFSLIGRSFAGGYDDHGERSLYSQIIVIGTRQLRQYENNAVLLARTLTSAGAWMLPIHIPNSLREINIPDRVLNPYVDNKELGEKQRILNAIDLHKRVGITVTEHPLEFMGRFLQCLAPKQRSKLSFSTGRRYFESAPFKISFYPTDDVHLEQDLKQKQVYPIRIRSTQR